MQFVFWVGYLAVLFVLSIEDLKYKSVSWLWLAILTILNLIHLFDMPFPMTNVLSAMIVLVILSILSVCSKKQFGMGDVWFITVQVMGMGVRHVLWMILFASCGVLLWAIVQYTLKRSNQKHDQVAFIPFLAGAFFMMMIP